MPTTRQAHVSAGVQDYHDSDNIIQGNGNCYGSQPLNGQKIMLHPVSAEVREIYGTRMKISSSQCQEKSHQVTVGHCHLESKQGVQKLAKAYPPEVSVSLGLARNFPQTLLPHLTFDFVHTPPSFLLPPPPRPSDIQLHEAAPLLISQSSTPASHIAAKSRPLLYAAILEPYTDSRVTLGWTLVET
jgi:hypothetical protein